MWPSGAPASGGDGQRTRGEHLIFSAGCRSPSPPLADARVDPNLRTRLRRARVAAAGSSRERSSRLWLHLARLPLTGASSAPVAGFRGARILYHDGVRYYRLLL